jgi:hypothetical protein
VSRGQRDGSLRPYSIKWIKWGVSQWLKRLVSEADDTLPSSAKVKNVEAMHSLAKYLHCTMLN